METAKIVHRDVSGGNILILPLHVFDPSKGKMVIKWHGLLVDWELSKPVHENQDPPRARQPERTVRPLHFREIRTGTDRFL